MKTKGFTTFSLHKRGFTLVELLVVISIIAILSVIGITIFSGVQKNARDARRKGDIDAIAKAMEVNYGRFEHGLCKFRRGRKILQEKSAINML